MESAARRTGHARERDPYRAIVRNDRQAASRADYENSDAKCHACYRAHTAGRAPVSRDGGAASSSRTFPQSGCEGGAPEKIVSARCRNQTRENACATQPSSQVRGHVFLQYRFAQSLVQILHDQLDQSRMRSRENKHILWPFSASRKNYQIFG